MDVRGFNLSGGIGGRRARPNWRFASKRPPTSYREILHGKYKDAGQLRNRFDAEAKPRDLTRCS